MRQLNSNFKKNRILDKKSTILTDEDMERRNKKQSTRSIKMFEKDVKIVRMLSFYMDKSMLDMMKEFEEQYAKDIESGEYVPPKVPLRLRETFKWNLKTMNFTQGLYEAVKEQSDRTGTPFRYLFSDYVEFYYKRSKYYTNKRYNKPRFFVEMEGKVDQIIEERKENYKKRW